MVPGGRVGCTVAGPEDIAEARALLPALPALPGATCLAMRANNDVLVGIVAVSLWPAGVRLEGAWPVDGAWDRLGPLLIDGLRACAAGGGIDAELRDADVAAELRALGFSLRLVSDRWEGPVPAGGEPGAPEVSWVPFSDVGADAFARAVDAVSVPADAALRLHGSVAAALAEWTFAATPLDGAPDRRGWWVLRSGPDVVGVVLSVVDPGPPGVSGLQYVAVAPGLRGTGIGSAITRAALGRLHALGATVHRDATDVDNHAMAAIFTRLGLARSGGLWRLRRAAPPPPAIARCLADVLEIFAGEGQAVNAGLDPSLGVLEGRIDQRAGRVEVEWREEGRMVELRHVVASGVGRDRFVPLMVAANRANAALWLPGFVFEEDAARLVYRQALLLDADDSIPRARLMRGLWSVLVAATDFRAMWGAYREAGLPGRGHGIGRHPLRPPVDPPGEPR